MYGQTAYIPVENIKYLDKKNASIWEIFIILALVFFVCSFITPTHADDNEIKNRPP